MGLLPGRVTVDLDSRAYEFIPQGHPLSDPRKEQITIGQLLSMSAGIPGSGCGVMGMATTSDAGPFEFALGRCPNRHGKWVDKLFGDPGTVWNYSDASYVHLALAFRHITGREMSDYLPNGCSGRPESKPLAGTSRAAADLSAPIPMPIRDCTFRRASSRASDISSFVAEPGRMRNSFRNGGSISPPRRARI